MMMDKTVSLAEDPPGAATGPSAPPAAASGIRADDVLARLQVMAHRYQDAGRIDLCLENDLIQLMQAVLPTPTIEQAATAFLDRLMEILPQIGDAEAMRLRDQLRRALLRS